MAGLISIFATAIRTLSPLPPSALRAIGASACAEIVEGAIKLISPVPSSNTERCAALDALTEKDKDTLEWLDSKFFEYPDNLTDLLFNHVAKHPKIFGPVPK